MERESERDSCAEMNTAQTVKYREREAHS